MTDREKEIEELARAIFYSGVAIDGTDIAYGLTSKDSHFHRMAAKLIEAGYRKSEEVRKETAKSIFYVLEKLETEGRAILPLGFLYTGKRAYGVKVKVDKCDYYHCNNDEGCIEAHLEQAEKELAGEKQEP